MSYKYKEPTGEKHTVSIKKWNSVFAYRGGHLFIKCCVWVSDDQATVHFYYTLLTKALVTILYPVVVVMAGYKEANREFLGAWNQKRRGSFSSEVVYKDRGSEYVKLRSIL